MVTIERESRHINKDEWGDGAWQSEPDKVQWTDERTGLPCIAVRVEGSGHWCGYVGVAEGHPLYGLEYDAADKLAPPDDDDYRAFRVHGGLTFAGACQEGAEETGICHVPRPGQPDRVWWFGFDCAHCDDLNPASFVRSSLDYQRVMRSNPRYAYRTLEYVQTECADLAAQLHTVE